MKLKKEKYLLFRRKDQQNLIKIRWKICILSQGSGWDRNKIIKEVGFGGKQKGG